ncbi:MAG: sterol desaturase family protein [Actinomycetes bacterium]
MSDPTAPPQGKKSASKLYEGALGYILLPIAFVSFMVVVLNQDRPSQVIFAIGVFSLVAVEGGRWIWAKRHHERATDDSTVMDATTSFSTSIITSVANNLVIVPLAFFVMSWVYSVTPLHFGDRVKEATGDYYVPVTLVIVLFGADFLYYWGHRAGHQVELLWGSHSVHHSSEHFNPSTATRLAFFDEMWDMIMMTGLVVLGFDPRFALGAYALVLLYQLPLHQSWLPKLWAPIEFVFNTPHHHRAHHAFQKRYIDKNFAGVLIIWDRIFGTFASTEEDPRYGLTVPIGTYNPLRVMFHELGSLGHKMKHAGSPGVALAYAFHHPYWEPEE